MKQALIGAVCFSIGCALTLGIGVFKRFDGSYRLEEGFYDEVHKFTPFSCETTKANGETGSFGTQRFLLTTGPSIEALAKYQSIHYRYDETASSGWHGKIVWIDYKTQHEVCVKNMGFETDTCFDLYELGER